MYNCIVKWSVDAFCTGLYGDAIFADLGLDFDEKMMK